MKGRACAPTLIPLLMACWADVQHWANDWRGAWESVEFHGA
jgi:hypothetical protein